MQAIGIVFLYTTVYLFKLCEVTCGSSASKAMFL